MIQVTRENKTLLALRDLTADHIVCAVDIFVERLNKLLKWLRVEFKFQVVHV